MDDKIGTNDGFAMAAAVTSYDGNLESIEDERYGTVKFFLKTWESSYEINFRELKQRPCSSKDYDEVFYPMHARSVGQANFLLHKMKCIDEAYELFGDYHADAASNVQAVFVRCDPSKQTTCASEQEIEDWLKFKYIVTIENVEQYR